MTALDTDGDLVCAALNSGELMVLRARDGLVCARHDLRAGGHGVVPLSLALAGRGRLAVGTLDGRVLVCSLRGLPDVDTGCP